MIHPLFELLIPYERPTGDPVLNGACRMIQLGADIVPCEIKLDAKGKKNVTFYERWGHSTGGSLDQLRKIQQTRAYAVRCTPSRLVCVDLDLKTEGGVNGAAVWLERGFPRSNFIVRTRSGGRHHWFKVPDGEPMPATCHYKELGIDIQAADCVVFGPGSRVLGTDAAPQEYRISVDTVDEDGGLTKWA